MTSALASQIVGLREVLTYWPSCIVTWVYFCIWILTIHPLHFCGIFCKTAGHSTTDFPCLIGLKFGRPWSFCHHYNRCCWSLVQEIWTGLTFNIFSLLITFQFAHKFCCPAWIPMLVDIKAPTQRLPSPICWTGWWCGSPSSYWPRPSWNGHTGFEFLMEKHIMIIIISWDIYIYIYHTIVLLCIYNCIYNCIWQCVKTLYPWWTSK